jgi:hypothetical protein
MRIEMTTRQTFLNLPEEKRRRITDVAMERVKKYLRDVRDSSVDTVLPGLKKGLNG